MQTSPCTLGSDVTPDLLRHSVVEVDAPIALGFAAGMVASLNPCGFSLLPAYVGVFVAGDRIEARVEVRVARAVGVAAAVTLGFIAIFVTAGLILNELTSGLQRQLPWVTIGIGVVLVIGGLAGIAGWKPTLRIAAPQVAQGRRDMGAMVAYGATYAVASLSCTLGPFLAVTGAALNRSVVGGLATYVAYALGMGVVILAISMAAALARSTVTTGLRRMSRLAPRLGGFLMVLAGGYAIWYGRWEMSVYRGDLDTDRIVEFGEDLRLRVVEVIDRFGANRVGAGVVLIAIAAIASGFARRQVTRDTRSDTAETGGLQPPANP